MRYYFLIGIGIVFGAIITAAVVSMALDKKREVAYLEIIASAYADAQGDVIVDYPHD